MIENLRVEGDGREDAAQLQEGSRSDLGPALLADDVIDIVEADHRDRACELAGLSHRPEAGRVGVERRSKREHIDQDIGVKKRSRLHRPYFSVSDSSINWRSDLPRALM